MVLSSSSGVEPDVPRTASRAATVGAQRTRFGTKRVVCALENDLRVDTPNILSWSGTGKAPYGVVTLAYSGTYQLYNVSTARYLGGLKAVIQGNCFGAGFGILPIEYCNWVNDDANGATTKWSYRSTTGIKYGQEYRLTYTGKVKISASPSWFGVSMAHDASGLTGKIYWTQ